MMLEYFVLIYLATLSYLDRAVQVKTEYLNNSDLYSKEDVINEAETTISGDFFQYDLLPFLVRYWPATNTVKKPALKNKAYRSSFCKSLLATLMAVKSSLS